MSELRNNSTSEFPTSPIEATPFTSDDIELDFRKSSLPPKATGLKFALEARAAIEAALAENPRPPSREQLAREGARSIWQVGRRIEYMRISETENAPQISEDEHFRRWSQQMGNAPTELNNSDYELTGSHRG